MATPVILDTDIGFDVDDVWALAFLLRCPELDVKLIASVNGDTTYGAAMVAQLLQAAGRPDIPIGIGIPVRTTPPHHAEWVDPAALSHHAGPVHTDAVDAIVDTIADSAEPVTVIAIGPLTNVAAALLRAPTMMDNSRLVGMLGSMRRGYFGRPKPNREYNVATDPAAAQTVFEADWDRTITPLDTCGLVGLDGDRFARIRSATDPLLGAVIENHDLWCRTVEWVPQLGIDPAVQSSILYDTVAVYLAFAHDLVVIEELNVTIDDRGATHIDPEGHPVRCATEWRDLDAFLDLLVTRLDSP